MADPFEILFREYARAFDESDAEKIASYFACPCLMVNGDGTAAMTSEDAILQNMRGLVEYHRANRFGRAFVSDLHVAYQAENLAIVRVRWRVQDLEEAPLWEWLNTYNFVEYGKGWKILVSTTHSNDH